VLNTNAVNGGGVAVTGCVGYQRFKPVAVLKIQVVLLSSAE